ncbi:hypothetical protein B0H17DRAFT_1135081 [Mycena rosella]|uniref:F-box domain-containing protein n=1 Tax=Mycena rosella TaxID=1033263 RepID=A0AAD7DDY1_MYCRO|nr:hypothetical protein B0H17DRAFT_1135081 [Mycena rosella]
MSEKKSTTSQTLSTASRHWRTLIDIFTSSKPKDQVSEKKKSRRASNATIPLIARLPPELLAEIFLLRVPTKPENMSDPGWITVSHVSHHWRQTALLCPAFWATPIIRCPALARMMISRSVPYPLVLRVSQANHAWSGAISLLRKYPERLGVIDVHADQHIIKYLLARTEVERRAAPLLRAVTIVNRSPFVGDAADAGVDVGMWLDEDMFLRNESAVRGGQLHLECCAFPWTSAWYSQLAHLHLERLARTYHLPMPDLFAILRRSRTLESLALIDVWLEGKSDAALELPKLRELRVRAWDWMCIRLMAQLTLPAIERFQMVVVFDSEFNDKPGIQIFLPSVATTPAFSDRVNVEMRGEEMHISWSR